MKHTKFSKIDKIILICALLLAGFLMYDTNSIVTELTLIPLEK